MEQKNFAMISIALFKGNVPPPPKPPAPPSLADASGAAGDTNRRTQARKGFLSTILTSGMGTEPGGGMKNLLGL